ncbi:MAG: SDR family oxidoreductase [Myxococcales bacterium]|nr:SDR family oxidoreductase [Myxococcales bacterium]
MQSKQTKWTSADIPTLRGRTAVVTGTGGLGYEASLALARAGASVVIAGRNPDKGVDAVTRIRAEAPEANVRFEAMDLADLRTIEPFAQRLRERADSVDILINNAAVMQPPTLQRTSDGFELQLGTNYLGHFALTARLLPLLRASSGARVVSVSSVAARDGAIQFDDLHFERRYESMRAYSQSKLACLLFAFELDRRSRASGWGVTSIAAHPGIARTELLHNAPGRRSVQSVLRSALWFLFQPAWQGALPVLFAATSPDAGAGQYYGPDRLGETRGYPALAKVPAAAEERATAERLWAVSEAATGVSFGASDTNAAHTVEARERRS